MAANLRKTNKCYRCGAEIEPGSRYCMECGAPLKKPHGNGMIAGVAAALVIVAVFGGNAFKKNAKEADTDTDVQTESLVSDVDFEDQMTETQEQKKQLRRLMRILVQLTVKHVHFRERFIIQVKWKIRCWS